MVGARGWARNLIIRGQKRANNGKREPERAPQVFGELADSLNVGWIRRDNVGVGKLDVASRWECPMEAITMPAASVIQATTEGAQQSVSAAAGTQAATGGPGTAYSQDAVDLTETGNRGAVAVSSVVRAQSPFLASRFAAYGATGAAASSAASQTTLGSNGNGVLGSAADGRAGSAGTSKGASAGAATATARAPIPSAAAQARLQKLNQVLENLGINPEQISYSERVSLLPLTNDPAALEQVVQGLQTQVSGSEKESASVAGQDAAPAQSTQQKAAAAVNGTTLASGQSATATQFTATQNTAGAATAKNLSIALMANANQNSTGQRINISV